MRSRYRPVHNWTPTNNPNRTCIHETTQRQQHLFDTRARRSAARVTQASVCYFRPTEHEIPGGDGLSEMRERAASLRAFREVSARYFREEAPPHSRSDFSSSRSSA
jgi:hypothetical protein